MQLIRTDSVIFAFATRMSQIDKLTSQQALLPMMHRLIKEIRAIMTCEFQQRAVDLNKEQAIVLRLLSQRDGRPQHELALVTARDKTSLTRLLSTMEKKDLISRQKSLKDKRVNLVFITESGRQAIQIASPIMLNILSRAVSGIDEKRIEMTKELINDIYQNLNLEHEHEE